jgi:hypothetical protein
MSINREQFLRFLQGSFIGLMLINGGFVPNNVISKIRRLKYPKDLIESNLIVFAMLKREYVCGFFNWRELLRQVRIPMSKVMANFMGNSFTEGLRFLRYAEEINPKAGIFRKLTLRDFLQTFRFKEFEMRNAIDYVLRFILKFPSVTQFLVYQNYYPEKKFTNIDGLNDVFPPPNRIFDIVEKMEKKDLVFTSIIFLKI